MTSVSEGVFAFACLVLFAVPVVFVYHRVYDDGLFGRVGLLGVSFFSAIFLGEFAFGRGYHIEPEEAGLAASFAVFLTWHLLRFKRRMRRLARADSRSCERVA